MKDRPPAVRITRYPNLLANHGMRSHPEYMSPCLKGAGAPLAGGFKKKKDDLSIVLFVLALPIFPGRLQPSIVGRSELNFRVRDGNGWTLALINTNY